MWLLILAIVILCISAPLTSYISLCYRHEERYLRPMIFNRHETLFIVSDLLFLIAGFGALFATAGWKWGLGGLAIYWVFVVFVFMPIVSRRFFSF